MPYILIADDNRQIADVLAEYARMEGYDPIIAYDGEDAVMKFMQHDPAVVLLDVMMPKKDGFEVCREIRRASSAPIIMITARGEDFEKIMGLDTGADDYIVKPFSPGEVMARVRAVMRRITGSDEKTPNSFVFENLSIDPENYEVKIGGKKVSLTKKETEILWTLASNKNRVFTRDNLLSAVWGYDYFGDSRTVDSHIKRLRAKLGEFSHDKWDISTIHGVGYRFEAADDEK